MKKCFNWDNNTLYVSDLSGNTFNLEFKGFKTIINGKSAAGKSLLCGILENLMSDLNPDDFKEYDTSNIFIVNKQNITSLRNLKRNLIIIDRADIILDKKTVEIINYDCGINKYLIFSRKPLGIDISPNYFGILEEHNGVFTIKYEFDIGGWN